MTEQTTNKPQLKDKLLTLKSELYGKWDELSEELTKDELSRDIMAKIDELLDLLQKKYGATKATAMREADELRSMVKGYAQSPFKKKPNVADTVEDIKTVVEDKVEDAADAVEKAAGKIKEAVSA